MLCCVDILDRRENETHLYGLMTMVRAIAKAPTTTATIAITITTTTEAIEELPETLVVHLSDGYLGKEIGMAVRPTRI